jgi:hypothetical protein
MSSMDTDLLNQVALIEAINVIVLFIGVSIVLWLTRHR